MIVSNYEVELQKPKQIRHNCEKCGESWEAPSEARLGLADSELCRICFDEVVALMQKAGHEWLRARKTH